MSIDNPIYETFAAEYEDHAAVSPYNAQYDRPAMLRLIGDVHGKDVLDAGCGPGIYSEELQNRGARTTGLDNSPTMIELARTRLGSKAELRIHDLSSPLDWVGDASFDLVIMALVIHYLDDRVRVLREMFRVLRPGGHLLVSTHHPTRDWNLQGKSYFTTEVIEETWSRGWEMRYWRLPLTQTCAEFAEAGFLIANLEEPLPNEAMKDSHPKRYEQLSTEPAFINFKLLKPPTPH